MNVTRNEDGTFSCSGHGPLYKIVGDGISRKDSLRAFASLFVQQRIRVKEECPRAYEYVMEELEAPMMEGNWEQAWMEDRPQEYARYYAECEAMTAHSLARDNDQEDLG